MTSQTDLVALFYDLNAEQADGLACVECYADFTTTNTPHVPVGCAASTRCQVFACAPAVGYVPPAGEQLVLGAGR